MKYKFYLVLISAISCLCVPLASFALPVSSLVAFQSSPGKPVETCPACRGSGKFGTGNCLRCDGKGFLVVNPGHSGQKPPPASRDTVYACSACNGTGRFGNSKCLKCAGRGQGTGGTSGYTPPRDASKPPPAIGMINCPACNGKGKIGNSDCLRCRGKGFLRANGSPVM